MLARHTFVPFFPFGNYPVPLASAADIRAYLLILYHSYNREVLAGRQLSRNHIYTSVYAPSCLKTRQGNPHSERTKIEETEC